MVVSSHLLLKRTGVNRKLKVAQTQTKTFQLWVANFFRETEHDGCQRIQWLIISDCCARLQGALSHVLWNSCLYSPFVVKNENSVACRHALQYWLAIHCRHIYWSPFEKTACRIIITFFLFLSFLFFSFKFCSASKCELAEAWRVFWLSTV